MATFAVGLLYAALPHYLVMGPRWLLLVVIAILFPALVITHRGGHVLLNRTLGFFSTGILTLAMVWSLILLVDAIPRHEIDPKVLLRSALELWVTNILVFALWYWRLDAGGPHGRDSRDYHTDGAFLFPQMNLPNWCNSTWTPNFIDYLFLAFNTSTALSPADTQALSRWAKILMMVQATISLIVIALLAARAVNIL